MPEHTGLRVSEIAKQVGFDRNAHFMQQFRSKVGMAALEYRMDKPSYIKNQQEAQILLADVINPSQPHL